MTISDFFRCYSPKRALRKFFLLCSHLPLLPHHRWIFLKMGGVRFSHKYPKVFLYRNITIDTVRPDLIEIGNQVAIAEGCKIITHFLDPSQKGRMYRYGNVKICNNAFIGMNTIICNSVTIGEGAVIGAGSVVTKDIPPYQVWAGNPARFIKERAH